MPRLSEYDYVFAIGTFFAMLDVYNNGGYLIRSNDEVERRGGEPFDNVSLQVPTMSPMPGLPACPLARSPTDGP